MATQIEVKVPDIGDYDDVPVIELLVAVGDRVAVDQGLVTLESDKATMEVPSPAAGVVKALKVAVGDAVSEGKVIAILEAEGEGGDDAEGHAGAPAPAPAPEQAPAPAATPPPSVPPTSAWTRCWWNATRASAACASTSAASRPRRCCMPPR